MKFLILISVIVLIINLETGLGLLSIRNKEFYDNNEHVFLSGVNIPWVSYARDFGSGAYAHSKAKIEQDIVEVAAAGGNAIRIWIHIDGQWSPKFDAKGFATGADTHSLIAELGEMLDFAAKHDVFVILCLWNLAVKPEPMIHLYSNLEQLHSYLDKVLKPMVTALKNKPSLAAWEIINEPSGSFAQGVANDNPCWNTEILKGSGTDWTHSHLPIHEVMRFINLHSAAIKSVDPKALVTVGDGEQTMTTICGDKCRDYYSDHCLALSGGVAHGTLDFYQLHSYKFNGQYSDGSPFKHHYNAYKSTKLIMVSEFDICNQETNYKQIYESGYAGALSWGYDKSAKCADKGMESIKGLTTNGRIRIKI